MASLLILQSQWQRGESPKLEGLDKTQRQIHKECENDPFLINNNREDQNQPNIETFTETVDNLAPFEIETIENHTADLANPSLSLSKPVILVVNEPSTKLNPLFTYSKNIKNPAFNHVALPRAPGTTPAQPQMVTRGGNTSNSTPMTI